MAKPATKGGVPATRKPNVPAKNDSNVPAFMKGDQGKGTERIDTSDMEMPRIKLVNAIEQELIATHDGLKAGDFFHTLAEVNLGNNVRIVPLHISKRVVLWRPRPPIDSGGILARADDGVHWVPANKEFEVKIDKKGTKATWKTAETVAESGLLNWGTYDPDDENSQPAATLCYVYVVYMPDFPEYSPAILMLQRGAVKVARKFNSKINVIGGRAPVYGQQYIMASSLDTNAAGEKFHNYTFTADGFVDDEQDYVRFKELAEQFDRKGVQIKDLEGAQEDGASDEGGAARGRAEAPRDQRTGRSRY